MYYLLAHLHIIMLHIVW